MPIGYNDSHCYQSYFFKIFDLPRLPLAAWLVLAAYDGFTCYLNGKQIEAQLKPGKEISALVNLLPFLKKGRNFLAIRVRRHSFGPVWLLAEGECIFPEHTLKLQTDLDWLVRRTVFDEHFKWYEYNPLLFMPSPSPFSLHASRLTFHNSCCTVHASRIYGPMKYVIFPADGTSCAGSFHFFVWPGKRYTLAMKYVGIMELSVNGQPVKIDTRPDEAHFLVARLNGLTFPLLSNEISLKLTNFTPSPYCSFTLLEDGKEVSLSAKGIVPGREVSERFIKVNLPATELNPVPRSGVMAYLLCLSFLFWLLMTLPFRQTCRHKGILWDIFSLEMVLLVVVMVTDIKYQQGIGAYLVLMQVLLWSGVCFFRCVLKSR